ncbi:hypothetical protein D3C71_2011190 [compost metagenome]
MHDGGACRYIAHGAVFVNIGQDALVGAGNIVLVQRVGVAYQRRGDTGGGGGFLVRGFIV